MAKHFNNAGPYSVGLIGMRDVRDYKVKSGGSERLNTSTPFNIKAESLTLSNFSLPDYRIPRRMIAVSC
ncbi:hypothetical protein BCV64_07025 [Cylindrospermopsis raciborskii MVCC14]|nr:hypothetical protein BCV64_07025 [Cylindrospermopsis raciborskii MVCC14]